MMKHRLSGCFAPRTLSAALLAGAFGVTSFVSSTALAHLPQVEAMCSTLTPQKIAEVTSALEAARLASKAATEALGRDPESPSSYPDAEIRYARATWQTELDYIATVDPAYTVPYIAASNVALSLENASIDMMYMLQHGRYWATATAYHFSVTDQALSEKYLKARTAINNAINKVQEVAHRGSRCAVGSSFDSPELPNP